MVLTVLTSCATFIRPCTGTCMVIIRATLKAGIRKPESGNQKPETENQNPESGIRNPESGIRNPESGIENDNRKIQVHLAMSNN